MRDQVEMPGEPKYKKFEDWQKKGTVYYNSFKGAKRTIPEGAAPIIMPPSGKKDEYEVIVPEHTLFEWNSGSQLTLDPLKVTNLKPTDKSKVFVYHRFTLSGKGECTWYSPVYSVHDFRKEDLAYEDDAKEITRLYTDFTEEHPLWAGEEVAVVWPGAGKMDKAANFELLRKFTDCTRTIMPNCSPVSMGLLPDKDGKVVHECIVPVIYTFKWSSALNDVFKIEVSDGSQVELRSFDYLRVDRTGIVAADFGKIISFEPFFNPAVNIQPV